MSHALGNIRHPKTGAILGWLEYNGTCDVCVPTIRPTEQEVYDHWRKYDGVQECTCEGERQEVEVWTSYGAGSSWVGEWCPSCKVLTSGFTEGESWEKLSKSTKDFPW